MHLNNDIPIETFPPVCLVITAWNQTEKTIACLQTVLAQDYPTLTVVLVDNGSEADLSMSVQSQFPTVILLTNPANLGFAGGYNRGLQWAIEKNYPYIGLFNNDTLLASDAITELVSGLTAEPEWGLATAKVYYADNPQRIWTVGERVHPFWLDVVTCHQNQLDIGQWEQRVAIDFAPFCAVLLRHSVLKEVGMLDEGFFVYFEDMDYCRRMLGQGIGLGLVPKAKVWHAVSSSSGGGETPRYRYWLGQSQGRYFRKHGRGFQLIFLALFKTYSALRNCYRLWRVGQTMAAQAYLLGLWRGWLTGQATMPPPAWVTTTTIMEITS